jgi:hypothetical protein
MRFIQLPALGCSAAGALGCGRVVTAFEAAGARGAGRADVMGFFAPAVEGFTGGGIAFFTPGVVARTGWGAGFLTGALAAAGDATTGLRAGRVVVDILACFWFFYCTSWTKWEGTIGDGNEVTLVPKQRQADLHLRQTSCHSPLTLASHSKESWSV